MVCLRPNLSQNMRYFQTVHYILHLFQCSNKKTELQNWKADNLARINQIILVSHSGEALDHLNSNCLH